MSVYTADKTAAAMVMIVVIDQQATDDTAPISHEEYSYYPDYQSALIASKALIEARGWIMPKADADAWLSGGWRGYDQEHKSVSCAVFEPDAECQLDGGPWVNYDRHMGAVYAMQLDEPATVTRKVRSFA